MSTWKSHRVAVTVLTVVCPSETTVSRDSVTVLVTGVMVVAIPLGRSVSIIVVALVGRVTVLSALEKMVCPELSTLSITMTEGVTVIVGPSVNVAVIGDVTPVGSVTTPSES